MYRNGENTSTSTSTDTVTDISSAFEKTCNVILWNDDVNSLDHVVVAVSVVVGCSPAKAFEVAKEAHTKDRAVAATETRERAELFQEQFATLNLKTTLETNE